MFAVGARIVARSVSRAAFEVYTNFRGFTGSKPPFPPGAPRAGRVSGCPSRPGRSRWQPRPRVALKRVLLLGAVRLVAAPDDWTSAFPMLALKLMVAPMTPRRVWRRDARARRAQSRAQRISPVTPSVTYPAQPAIEGVSSFCHEMRICPEVRSHSFAGFGRLPACCTVWVRCETLGHHSVYVLGFQLLGAPGRAGVCWRPESAPAGSSPLKIFQQGGLDGGRGGLLGALPECRAFLEHGPGLAGGGPSSFISIRPPHGPPSGDPLQPRWCEWSFHNFHPACVPCRFIGVEPEAAPGCKRDAIGGASSAT